MSLASRTIPFLSASEYVFLKFVKSMSALIQVIPACFARLALVWVKVGPIATPPSIEVWERALPTKDGITRKANIAMHKTVYPTRR